MNLLGDTSVLSAAFRRSDIGPEGRLVERLITENRIILPGCVRQELLSGLRRPEQFEQLRDVLAGLPHAATIPQDYETAARFSNLCRWKGIQGSPTDFLICSVAYRLQLPVLTTDNDFSEFAKVIPVTVYDQAVHG